MAHVLAQVHVYHKTCSTPPIVVVSFKYTLPTMPDAVYTPEGQFLCSDLIFHSLCTRDGLSQQALMVGAGAALHNFLHIHEPIDLLDEDNDYDVEDCAFFREARDTAEAEGPVYAVDNAEKMRADACWDWIANAMWTLYLQDHPDLV